MPSPPPDESLAIALLILDKAVMTTSKEMAGLSLESKTVLLATFNLSVKRSSDESKGALKVNVAVDDPAE